MNSMQDKEDRISFTVYKVKEMFNSVKDNVKAKIIQTQNIQEVLDTMKTQNL